MDGRMGGTTRAGETPARLLTAKEAAQLLRISVSQLWRLVADGELPYVVVGRTQKRPRRLIEHADVDAFIERRKGRNIPLDIHGRARAKKQNAYRDMQILEMRKKLLRDAKRD